MWVQPLHNKAYFCSIHLLHIDRTLACLYHAQNALTCFQAHTLGARSRPSIACLQGTAWHRYDYMAVGSGYTADMVLRGRAKACLDAKNCSGPYPFSTGSLQGLSMPLARLLATSQAAADNLEALAMLETNGSFAGRTTPAYEDAWMGFGLIGLLSPDDERNIHMVELPRHLFFDDFSFAMNNITMVVHWRANKDNQNVHTARMRASHWYAQSHHCAANASLFCGVRSHATSWASRYSSIGRGGGSCKGCVPSGRWTYCALVVQPEGCDTYGTYRFPIRETLSRFLAPPWTLNRDHPWNVTSASPVG